MQPAKLLGPPSQSHVLELNGIGESKIISPRAERPPSARAGSVERSNLTVRAGSVDRSLSIARAGSVERAFTVVRASSVVSPRNEMKSKKSDASALGIDLSDPSSFLSAAFKGEIEKITFFLSQDTNMNMNVVDSLGNTALHLSAFSGHETVVKLLLQTKSVLNSPKVRHPPPQTQRAPAAPSGAHAHRAHPPRTGAVGRRADVRRRRGAQRGERHAALSRGAEQQARGRPPHRRRRLPPRQHHQRRG